MTHFLIKKEHELNALEEGYTVAVTYNLYT